MKMKEIYLVRGECGEYSDHSEWTIAAYDTESQAQGLKDQLQGELFLYNTMREIMRTKKMGIYETRLVRLGYTWAVFASKELFNGIDSNLEPENEYEVLCVPFNPNAEELRPKGDQAGTVTRLLGSIERCQKSLCL